MTLSTQDRIIKSRINLLRNSPFFGTLLLNAKVEVTDEVPTAATNGDVLYINEGFMNGLSDQHFCSVLTHEVLHMALEHVDRLERAFMEDANLANIAADIVVNGIIRDNGLSLPSDAIYDDDLKHLCALEIYSILKKRQQEQRAKGGGGEDDNNGQGKNKKSVNQCLQPQKKSNNQESSGEGQDGDNAPSPSQAKTRWKDVLNKAMTISKSKQAGLRGAGLQRVFKELLEPTIDWRDALYKYITVSRTDFESFDRRFIHQGNYFDDLGGGKINIMVFIDTSASVDEKLLSEFIAEIRFAVNALPQISGELWYFDTKLYPQGDVKEILGVPKLQGGGGTSFIPAMKKLDEMAEEDSTVQTLGIVFTDGHASFSFPEPITPVLWCVSPGGLADEGFPFGEIVRIMK
jgi:predicted metal-dependent peptidase